MEYQTLIYDMNMKYLKFGNPVFLVKKKKTKTNFGISTIHIQTQTHTPTPNMKKIYQEFLLFCTYIKYYLLLLRKKLKKDVLD